MKNRSIADAVLAVPRGLKPANTVTDSIEEVLTCVCIDLL